MKKYNIIIFLVLISATFVGCSKFEKMNLDPNNPSQVRAEQILDNIIFTALSDDVDIANKLGIYSTFVGYDMGACWAQHIAKNNYNQEERYLPRVNIFNSFWNTMYEGVCKNANTMEILAKEEGNETLQGMAKVLKAYGFSILTDTYGDIPFSEALQAKEQIFLPKYDKQEDVYKGILSLLDEAVVLLSSSSAIVPSSDILYNGDVNKWIKFANSLKFRSLMRISGQKANTDIDITGQLQALFNQNNLFASITDDAKIKFASNQPAANPVYETVVYDSRLEFRMNSTLIDVLIANGDPRLNVYAEKNSDGIYFGKPSGFAQVPILYSNSKVSGIGSRFLAADAPGYLMTYSELQFLISEAIMKGYISGGNANSYYREGIKASFLNAGLTEADFNSYSTIPAVSLANIATQNWIALFGQGLEAWTEWRRTKLPALTPAIDAATSEIPSRYQYPIDEQSINKNNYNIAVTAQGPDLITTKIWWLK